MIVGDIIRRNAALFGDSPGLIFEGRRYTHRAFARRVCRVANALFARGVRSQEPVAILARNSSEVIRSGEDIGRLGKTIEVQYISRFRQGLDC